MKTLIELFDEQPLNNALSTEVFSPERTVFLCGAGVPRSQRGKRLIRYFEYRGFPRPLFSTVRADRVEDILARLTELTSRYPDCVLDVSGGGDTVLFAAGLFCASHSLPVISFDQGERRFRGVYQAEAYEGFPCEARLTVQDCMVLSGGAAMSQSRVSAQALTEREYQAVDDIWRVYVEHQKNWAAHVKYLQKIGVTGKDLSVSASARDGSLRASVAILEALGRAGLLLDLTVADRRVSFRYRDGFTRRCLCDVGMCLELFVFKTALTMRYFDDVQISTLIDWNGEFSERDNLYNEIDVMAVKQMRPLFISCKTCALTPSALNEIKVLSHRFGGPTARALIVTMDTPSSNTPTVEKRCGELGIILVDRDDLLRGRLPKILRRAAEG